MLRITVENVPHGIESLKDDIGTITIVNVGGTPDNGNYCYSITHHTMPGVVWRSGKIEGFPRKQMLVWDLLYQILKDAVGNRDDPAK